MSRTPEEVLRARLRAIRHGDNGRVADEAGIAAETLARWKGGTRGGVAEPLNPDLATLQRLAAALRMPLPALISDEAMVPASAVAAAREKIAEAEALLAKAQEPTADERRRVEAVLSKPGKGSTRQRGSTKAGSG